MAGEDSIVSGMAGRYARALFELALESQIRRCGEGRSREIRRHDRGRARTCAAWCAARCSAPRSRARALAAVLAKAGIGGLAANFLQVRDGQPPAVRGARDHPRLPQARRAMEGRGDRRGDRRRDAVATRTSRRSRTRSSRSPARSRSISTSRSIRRSSAGSSSSSAPAWSTVRSAPNSMRSSTR